MRKLSHDLSQVPPTHPESSHTSETPAIPSLSSAQNHSVSSSDSSSNVLEIKEPTVTANEPLLAEPTPPDTIEPSANNLSTSSGLSKSQLKKQKRKEAWEAGREDRKAKRRDKAKEKKARKRAERDEARAKAVQDQDDGEHAGNNHGKDQNERTWLPRKTHRFQQQTRVRLPIAFVLDCSFDKLMTEKEIISLGSQLTRCYSDNTKSPYSAHFYISSWTPESELRKRFEGLMRGTYRNWKGIEFTEQDFVEAGKMAHEAMIGPAGGKMAGMFEKYAQVSNTTEPTTTTSPDENMNGTMNEKDREQLPATATPSEEPQDTTVPTPSSNSHPQTSLPTSIPTSLPLQPPSHPRLIYLTSDSPHTLSTLQPYTTYIIGGLVDKNRHKSLCYNTAVRLNIPTAKLPLAQYMKMTSREVLATNHVAEIMLRWLDKDAGGGDWGAAFLGVLPKRKGAVLRGVDGKGGDEESDGVGDRDGDEDADSDDGGGVDLDDDDNVIQDLDVDEPILEAQDTARLKD